MPSINNKGYWEKTPEFANNESGARYRQDYWRQEADRWVNGYLFGDYGYLSGLHYFHLTMGNLVSGEYGNIRPDWRDADGLFFDAYLEAVAENKNLYEIKWRGFGFSSDCAAIIAWNTIVYEGSEIFVTSVDNGRLIRMRNKIVLPYLKGLQNEHVIPIKHYSQGLDLIQVPIINSVQEKSSIYFQETSSDREAIQKMESYRFRLAVLDELFLHKHYEDVLMSAEGSTTERGKKFGTIIAGGNCNNVNKDSAKRVTELCSHAESRGFKVHVTPGFMGRAGFMKKDPRMPMRQVSDIFRAKEEIQNKLDKYRQDGDIEKYLNYKKENLFAISDLMVSTSSAEISEDLQYKVVIGRQRAEMLNIIPCSLRLEPSGIFPSQDDNGSIYIAELPQEGHIYIAGGDPTLGTAQGDRVSDFAIAIKDITTGRYVAYYAEKNRDMQATYAKMKMLLLFYKSNTFPRGAPCMMERNAMAGVYTIALERGELYLLAADPKSKDGSVKGYHKAPNTNARTTYNALILNHVNRFDVPFTRFYNEFDVINDEPEPNLDLMDAMKSCEIYYQHLSRMPDEESQSTRKKRYIETNAQGITEIIWK